MISSHEIRQLGNMKNMEKNKINLHDDLNFQKEPDQEEKCRKNCKTVFGNILHKCNEGDGPSSSSEGTTKNVQEEDIENMQKWQSLGKVFRRQSIVHEKVQTLGRDIRKEADNLKSKGASVKNFITTYYQKAVNTITSRESSACSQRKHREKHASENPRERNESKIVPNRNGEIGISKN